MLKAATAATQGAAAIATHQEAEEAKYSALKKKVFKYMKADAAINGIPISKLKPSQYGLGEDPALSMAHSRLTKRRHVYQRMAKAAKTVIAAIKGVGIAPLYGAGGGGGNGGKERRRLVDAEAMSGMSAMGAVPVHTGEADPETKLAQLKQQLDSVSTESLVDQKIIKYLSQEEQRQQSLQKMYKKKEEMALQKEEHATGGVGATPVMQALIDLSKTQSQCASLFNPLLKRAKSLSSVAETCIRAIAGQGILAATAPATAFHFSQIKAKFVQADKLLQGVAPLFTRLHAQHAALLHAMAVQKARLEATSRTAEARKLQLAMATPEFLRETQEYNREAKLANLGFALAKKVEEVARHPGQGWLAAPMAGSGVGTSGGGPPQRRLMDAAGADLGGSMDVEGPDSVVAEHHAHFGGTSGGLGGGGGHFSAGVHVVVGMFSAGFMSGLAIVAGFKAKISFQSTNSAAASCGMEMEA